MSTASVNVHYHGSNSSPTCHSDEVIHTLINPGDTFDYDVLFPGDEPPGLYWYHPHVHGIAESAVQGGASGAIIVEGIQNLQPAVAGLPQRLLIIRDQNLPTGSPGPGNGVPSWDLSVNYVPILYPAYAPAKLVMRPGEKQFWRVLNAAADTILDLQLQFDGVPQTVQIAALDGVPTGSQDGTRQGKLVPATHILIPPAGRAEFIVTGPAPGVRSATLYTLNIDTGPDGDSDPMRPILSIQTSASAPEPALVPSVSGPAGPQRFEGLAAATPNITRTLYFSEKNAQQQFFITVDGQMPTLFNADNPPAITTTQGSVEDWIIQNRSQEDHEFHMHQIHFLLLEQNGSPAPPQAQQFLDMIQVPYWTGTGPYPSVKVRMDFRGPDIGDFVYHCHILNHEDQGMMAIIRVNPRDPDQTPAVADAAPETPR
ncbi:MAG: multicopper oxidase domain-containing protein [Acidobacteriia bacterium]|nr:multicopper oxidase domain-containing protein [Terriglobia bacterium]